MNAVESLISCSKTRARFSSYTKPKWFQLFHLHTCSLFSYRLTFPFSFYSNALLSFPLKTLVKIFLFRKFSKHIWCIWCFWCAAVMKVTCRLPTEQFYESGQRLFLSLQSTKVYLTEPQDFISFILYQLFMTFKNSLIFTSTVLNIFIRPPVVKTRKYK